MGIPSYFNYIIKKHSNVLCELSKIKNIDNLYLDSNSIIYDCLNKLNENELQLSQNELYNKIYTLVAEKIQYYIELVNPKYKVLIAFDGVAPLAKMEQQRTRRYKSFIQSNTKSQFNKSVITPGTIFMNGLSIFITNYFNNNLQDKNIFVSSSNTYGEGEHKIFEFIRDNISLHQKQKTLIYGLDADLIVLSLLHEKYCNNITNNYGLYLFREKHEYDTTIDTDYYCMNINSLKMNICKEINPNKNNDKLVSDYVFLSFMLGNDFMPHFPSLNIRTNGIEILLQTYINILNDDEYLTNNYNINWSIFYKFIKNIADNEQEYILNEEKILYNFDKKVLNSKRKPEKNDPFLNLPSKNRDYEKFINISEYGWEYRYYNILLNQDRNEKSIKMVSKNYLEALEWNLEYYTIGCKNYRWKYNFDYPPLLKDILLHIPVNHLEQNINFVETNKKPLDKLIQLAYVLPSNSLHCLPILLQKYMIDNYKHLYNEKHNFIWAYSRYFWESHVEMPVIDIDEMEIFINNTLYT
jgi:5'-3' exonuclease